MRLSCRILADVGGVNSFRTVESAFANVGDPLTVYLQLVDESLDLASEGFQPAGRRYCPPASTTLKVKTDSTDSTKKVDRSATQPFSNDSSVWKLELLSTDKVRGTIDLVLTLTEPTRVLTGRRVAGVRISDTSALGAKALG